MNRLFATLPLLLLATPAFAGVDKIESPAVEKGVAEISYSGTRYSDSDASRHNQQAHEVEFEYGVTDRLKLGISTEIEHEPGEASKFAAYGIEAQYALTTQGNYWLSSALKGEYNRAYHRDTDADELEAMLLASHKSGPVNVIGNLRFGHDVGPHRESGVEVSSGLQATYRFNRYLTPGLEWHADYGKLNDFGANDGHYVGPVMTGELVSFGGQELEYTAGYYWGIGSESTDRAARIELEYEFAF